MTLHLATPQDQKLQELERFLDTHVAPLVQDQDETDEFQPELLKGLAQLGIQRLHLDEDGELNYDEESFVRIHESSKLIASYSAGLATTVSVARLHTYLLLKYAQPAVRDKYVGPTLDAQLFGSFAMSEPNAGSDVRGMQSVLTKVPGGYELTGSKVWIGLAPVAAYSIVLAKIGSTDRSAPMGAVVVDLEAHGVTRGPSSALSGFRGMPNGGLGFEKVFVPDENVLTCDGFEGMFDGLNMARVEACSYSVGLIHRAITLSREFVLNREIFGKTLSDLQLTKYQLGNLLAHYHAAESITLRAARSLSDGKGGDNELISAAKIFAADSSRMATDTAMQLQGARGLQMWAEAERIHRDSKVMQTFDGTSEVHKLMLGKQVVTAPAVRKVRS